MKQHKMKHIKGTLMPSIMYSANTHTHINKAVIAHNLNWIIKKNRWEYGIIDINSVTIASRDLSDVTSFLISLCEMIQSENIEPLGLHGQLMITVETAGIQPIMFRVDVENGKVSCQKAVFEWTSPEFIETNPSPETGTVNLTRHH